mgnify:FL=1|tara:strand:+ start:735 stop:1526 length:792 start_codon:yes stop_codon:yes gene_type:complete
MSIVLSLYDYTGVAATPWAEAGHTVYCYDIQHDDTKVEHFQGGGAIHYHNADLHSYETMCAIFNAFEDEDVIFAMGFPVCTDLAVSGAAWFKKKGEIDPEFQTKACMYAMWCAEIFDDWGVPYYIENPVSRLSTLWRKPDHKFHPYEYGGYIHQDEASHPLYPEYIAPYDAYSKKTCLWTGGGFKMPTKAEVSCESFGFSRQHSMLGGKSMKTKNIRSATPRGFAIAVFEANSSPCIGVCTLVEDVCVGCDRTIEEIINKAVA